MKIGCLISSYLPKIGGAEAFTHNMATRLANMEHEVVVVTPSRGRAFDKLFKYKVERLNPLLMKLLFTSFSFAKMYVERKLSSLQDKYGFDVWQVTIGYPLGAAAVDFFNRSGIPCVLRCVGEDIQVYPPINYGYRLKKGVDKVVREQYRKFTAVIAASECMKDDFLSLGVPAEKISIIPNGVDCVEFEGCSERINIRRSVGVGDNQKLLLTIGRNHPKKGFDNILPIARILKSNNMDFKWCLVGKNCGKIKEEAMREGLENYFIVKDVKAEISPSGKLEVPARELVGYYKASDIFVFPTYIELFAKVLIEAMAAGLAIVTTDAPGVGEIITHDVNGLKARPGDAKHMAELIIKVFSDKELERRLKDNAYSAAKNYDWSVIVSRYAELYKRLSG